MKYVGSKNRLSKHLTPIIQSYIDDNAITKYLEPFVGGANMIDKIRCDKKIGLDAHKELIALLKYVQNLDNKLPITITEQEYEHVRDNKNDHEDWYVGLVGFCATFGAKYFGGYARGFKEDKTTPRDIPSESIRNIEKQRKDLQGIIFGNMSFLDIPKDRIKNYVIYCDPPYDNTLKYSTRDFQHDKFWDWCRDMSKDNIVLISEYNAPNDFECVWEKEHKVLIDSKKSSDSENNIRIEKLFKIGGIK